MIQQEEELKENKGVAAEAQGSPPEEEKEEVKVEEPVLPANSKTNQEEETKTSEEIVLSANPEKEL